MKNTPPAMLDKGIEFFTADQGLLMVITDGKMFPFTDSPLEILDQLSDQLENDPEAMMALDKFGITDPVERLQQFAICRYGDYDLRTDISCEGIGCTEYVDCGQRGNCASEGKLCPGIKVNNQYITAREIDVIRMVSQDLPDKLVADRLGITTSTARVHIQNILQKIDGHSKVAIAVFGKEKGIV
jgi:DNA-binding CsgD family transcriptional regulator